MNSCSFVGVVQEAPYLQRLNQDTILCSFPLRSIGKNQIHIDIISWNALATFVAENVQKGDRVAVSGYLQCKSKRVDQRIFSVLEVASTRVDLVAKAQSQAS